MHHRSKRKFLQELRMESQPHDLQLETGPPQDIVGCLMYHLPEQNGIPEWSGGPLTLPCTHLRLRGRAPKARLLSDLAQPHKISRCIATSASVVRV